jgi:hypothetical protein
MKKNNIKYQIIVYITNYKRKWKKKLLEIATDFFDQTKTIAVLFDIEKIKLLYSKFGSTIITYNKDFIFLAIYNEEILNFISKSYLIIKYIYSLNN